MQPFTAEQAHLIAIQVAGAIDDVSKRENATAVLEIHGPDRSVLAVVLTANPLLIPSLLKWARENENVGTLAKIERRRPPADKTKYRTCPSPSCGGLYDSTMMRCLTCNLPTRPATQQEADDFERLNG